MHSVTPATGVLTGAYWDAFLRYRSSTARRPAGWRSSAMRPADRAPFGRPGRRPRRRRRDLPARDQGRPELLRHDATPPDGPHRRRARSGARRRRAFDAIFVDAYRQPYIPFHLPRASSPTSVRRPPRPRRRPTINVGTPPKLTATSGPHRAHDARQFPAVQQARYNEFNSVVIGYRDAVDRGPCAPVAGDGDPATRRSRPDRVAPLLRDVPPGGAILTDDHSPIEWITDRALLEYLREGAPGAEKREDSAPAARFVVFGSPADRGRRRRHRRPGYSPPGSDLRSRSLERLSGRQPVAFSVPALLRRTLPPARRGGRGISSLRSRLRSRSCSRRSSDPADPAHAPEEPVRHASISLVPGHRRRARRAPSIPPRAGTTGEPSSPVGRPPTAGRSPLGRPGAATMAGR